MRRYSPDITIMLNAVRKASKHIIRDFGELEHLQVSVKGQNDFVTNVDLKVQEIIYRELSKARPDYGFIMEEGQSEKLSSKNIWIIDPIDGTLNFMHGLPYFAISIAIKSNNKIIAGIIYNPVQNEFYWAEEGIGAFLNEQRLRVSARQNLETLQEIAGTFQSPTAFNGYYRLMGMLYLMEGSPTKAEELFNQGGWNTYFDYFKALALKANGKKEEAKEILSNIAGDNFSYLELALVKVLAQEQLQKL